MLTSVLRGLFGKPRAHTLQTIYKLIADKKLNESERAIENLHPALAQRALHQSCLKAAIAFYRHADEDAESLYRDVLKEAPGFPEAHYGISLLLLERGDIDTAIEHAQFARTTRSTEPRYAAQLGLAYLKQCNFSRAEDELRLAATLDRADPNVWNNLGILHRLMNNFAYAANCFHTALELSPSLGIAQQNFLELRREAEEAGVQLSPASLAQPVNLPSIEGEGPWTEDWQDVVVLVKKAEFDSALAKAEALSEQYPDDQDLLCAVADLHSELGEIGAAVHLLEGGRSRGTGLSGQVHAKLGELLCRIQEEQAALQHLESARELGDSSVQTLALLALAYHKTEAYVKAVEAYRILMTQEQAGQYEPPFASALVSACLYDEAIEIYERLLKESPQYRGAILPSYAAALQYVGRLQESLDLVEEMLRVQPNAASLRVMRGSIRLQLGDYGRGWDDYAFRGTSYSKHFRTLPFAKWQGEPLADRTIVVLAEQGLGDQVMFASCLPDLLALKPGRVVVECVNRVAPTIARSFPECEVLSSRQSSDLSWAAQLGKVDYFVPLGDLPRFFRRTETDFPRQPYLVPAPERVAAWNAKLSAAGSRPWIGFSWRGGTEVTRKPVRSMPATNFDALEKVVGGTWVPLQYGDISADLAQTAGGKWDQHYWPEAIADLDEFAALLAALDGVVTVCNTTVHYAGAIGIPTWVLAPQVPEWRYGLTNETLPWYPESRVIRQSVLGQWDDVLTAAERSLTATFSSMRPSLADKLRLSLEDDVKLNRK